MKSLFMILFSLFLFWIFPTTATIAQPIATIEKWQGFEKIYNTANGKFIVVSNFGACAKFVINKKGLEMVWKNRQAEVRAYEKKHKVIIAIGLPLRCDMIFTPGKKWVKMYNLLRGFFELKSPTIEGSSTIIHLFGNTHVFIGYRLSKTKKEGAVYLSKYYRTHPPLPTKSCLITKPVRKDYYRVSNPCYGDESRHVGYIHANPKTGKLEYIQNLPPVKKSASNK